MICLKVINSIKKVNNLLLVNYFRIKKANKVIDVLCCKANVEGLDVIEFPDDKKN